MMHFVAENCLVLLLLVLRPQFVNSEQSFSNHITVNVY
jgi:hypothetical protein